jgi:hypothetical protein
MFSIVIVAPAAAVGLLSLDDAAAVSNALLELDDPPHAVTMAAMRAIAAKNIPIFFILTPNFDPYPATRSAGRKSSAE